jgi:hypothetical protein
VEIPGLIEGAADDRGGGRALLGVLRNADAILFCHACDRPPAELETIRVEVAAAGIELPAILAATKCDEARPPEHPELAVIPVSVLDDTSLDRLREELWAMTGLVRVHLRDGGDPVALHPPATVLDVADTVIELRDAVPHGSGGVGGSLPAGREGIRAERRRHRGVLGRWSVSVDGRAQRGSAAAGPKRPSCSCSSTATSASIAPRARLTLPVSSARFR